MSCGERRAVSGGLIRGFSHATLRSWLVAQSRSRWRLSTLTVAALWIHRSNAQTKAGIKEETRSSMSENDSLERRHRPRRTGAQRVKPSTSRS